MGKMVYGNRMEGMVAGCGEEMGQMESVKRV